MGSQTEFGVGWRSGGTWRSKCHWYRCFSYNKFSEHMWIYTFVLYVVIYEWFNVWPHLIITHFRKSKMIHQFGVTGYVRHKFDMCGTDGIRYTFLPFSLDTSVLPQCFIQIRSNHISPYIDSVNTPWMRKIMIQYSGHAQRCEGGGRRWLPLIWPKW